VLVLLPPSETKRDGGLPGSALDLHALSFPELGRERRAALAGLRRVSRSLSAASTALGLGPTQRFEIERNRAISTSPLMPAIERYTGVLYDGLGVETMDAATRGFLGETVVIHSALFGLLRADDAIPAYRFSHDSRVPGMPLAKLWRDAIATVLAAQAGLVLDLRSEAYVHFGPAPAREGSVFLRVVTEGEGGTLRALNHFNKKGKGEFVRALALARQDHDSVDSLIDWARSAGIRLRRGAEGELDLIV
jgi:cytoplasmic iron level regulating protein YaaA (DUF328/UPF0246 family)